ncbi:MAG: MFS transporter [Candidatus Dormibacteraeota bacterium]|nr:MFS transporter [Candidatus Dormibacteraeota bacterium]
MEVGRTAQAVPPANGEGPFGPLRHTVFRWLWFASLASQMGTWIQNVGAVDLMTVLAPTALMLALVQTATTLPGLFLALPSGALADVLDRRRLLVVASVWMLGVSALLAVTTLARITSAWWLLALTFAVGIGSVVGLPAWQAITQEVVPRAELQAAVTLSSVAVNLARAAGPAVGGVAVALAGPGAAFVLTAACFAFTTGVVVRWRRVAEPADLPAERVLAAVRTGFRYSLMATPVRAILVRSTGFIVFASALWALLPVVSRQLNTGSAGYSGLLASLGAGAVGGALLLPRIRGRLHPDAVGVTGTALFAAASLGVGLTPNYWALLPMMLVAGAAWVAAISTFNVSAQRAAPAWVRGRVIASYQVTYMGSMALGSAAWGTLANRLGVSATLVVATALLAAGAALALRWRLDPIEGLDLRPRRDWAQPVVTEDLEPRSGPVLVTLEYRVRPERQPEFLELLHRYGRLRRRDGALRWGVFRDSARPEVLVETFLASSWEDHLRQHERMTVSDQALDRRLRSLQEDGRGPVVSHYVYASPPAPSGGASASS